MTNSHSYGIASVTSPSAKRIGTTGITAETPVEHLSARRIGKSRKTFRGKPTSIRVLWTSVFQGVSSGESGYCCTMAAEPLQIELGASRDYVSRGLPSRKASAPSAVRRLRWQMLGFFRFS